MLYVIGQWFFMGAYPDAGFFETIFWPYGLGKRMRNYI